MIHTSGKQAILFKILPFCLVSLKNSAIGKHFHDAHGRSDLMNESHFKILRKCQDKFDCLVFEMPYIKKFKPNSNVQVDSICAKLFVQLVIFVIVFII